MPSGRRGPIAGDRAPDAPCRGAGGQPRRLFDLFQGTHWTLFGYEAGRHAALPVACEGLHIHLVGPDGDLIDDSAHIRLAYDLAPGDWVLVRPDGYIGAIVGADHVSALDAYFDRVGLSRVAECSVGSRA